MRTTLDIDEKLIADVLKATGEKSKSRAVNKVLEEYIRRQKIEEIIAMAGKIIIDDYSEEQRAADKRREDFLDQLRRGEV